MYNEKQGIQYLRAYRDLQTKGKIVQPHGTKTLELLNYQFIIPPAPNFVTSFRARNLNLTYCKQEWLWYLRGDRFDTSIEDHATMWKKIKQPDGGYNSNYGQYLFGKEQQFLWAFECLRKDIFSRQACIQLLNKSHMFTNNTDVVCTQSIQFIARDGKLHMYVSMRSNDAIWGLTNDAFCFANLHTMMLVALQEAGYSRLQMGRYYHRAGSFHVYERHFEMLDKLVDDWTSGHYEIDVPEPSSIQDFRALAHPEDYPNYTSEYVEWMRSCE